METGVTTLNPIITARWQFVAEKIATDPGLLQIPFENISRWVKSERLGDLTPLYTWQALDLKSCSPFPGVRIRDELRFFPCTWTH